MFGEVAGSDIDFQKGVSSHDVEGTLELGEEVKVSGGNETD